MDGKDRERLESLFTVHALQVTNYMRRRVTRVEDVEDLVAEVFLIAARRLQDIPVGHELPWLYLTARNVLSNWRRRTVPVPSEDVYLDVSLQKVDAVERVEFLEAWGRLQEREQEVLRLAAWEGLTGEELGIALGLSAGGAASALSRARQKLAGELDV